MALDESLLRPRYYTTAEENAAYTSLAILRTHFDRDYYSPTQLSGIFPKAPFLVKRYIYPRTDLSPILI